jgi:hypothetical protein
VKENRTTAFILNGEDFATPVGGKTWTIYGIIAAQRRACGSVRLVISGLAGPATLAAARLVKRIRTDQFRNNKPCYFLLFHGVRKTVETVSEVSPPRCTPINRGVNESGLSTSNELMKYPG